MERILSALAPTRASRRTPRRTAARRWLKLQPPPPQTGQPFQPPARHHRLPPCHHTVSRLRPRRKSGPEKALAPEMAMT